jgi:hypothetical protein
MHLGKIAAEQPGKTAVSMAADMGEQVKAVVQLADAGPDLAELLPRLESSTPSWAG